MDELTANVPDVSEGTYLVNGGWPELHARSDLDPHFWYAAYLGTSLERDVRNILDGGSLRDFDRFLKRLPHARSSCWSPITATSASAW